MTSPGARAPTCCSASPAPTPWTGRAGTTCSTARVRNFSPPRVDVLIGGTGVDAVSYASHFNPVTADIDDIADDGVCGRERPGQDFGREPLRRSLERHLDRLRGREASFDGGQGSGGRRGQRARRAGFPFRRPRGRHPQRRQRQRPHPQPRRGRRAPWTAARTPIRSRPTPATRSPTARTSSTRVRSWRRGEPRARRSSACGRHRSGGCSSQRRRRRGSGSRGPRPSPAPGRSAR